MHNRGPVGYGSERIEHFSVTLHVGFLCLIETPEELERLRRPEKPGKANEGPARSKIASTNLAEIRPIDRTAAKVV